MSKNCPNFLLCGNTIYLEEPICLIRPVEPICLIRPSEPICKSCNIIFKNCKNKILLFGIGTCPMCLTNNTLCISHPNCNHYSCKKCFLNYWNESKKICEPIFPYSSDMEEEYMENPNDIHWKNDKSIIKYNEEIEKILINCPLC